jgi:hypothetical protein
MAAPRQCMRRSLSIAVAAVGMRRNELHASSLPLLPGERRTARGGFWLFGCHCGSEGSAFHSKGHAQARDWSDCRQLYQSDPVHGPQKHVNLRHKLARRCGAAIVLIPALWPPSVSVPLGRMIAVAYRSAMGYAISARNTLTVLGIYQRCTCMPLGSILAARTASTVSTRGNL